MLLPTKGEDEACRISTNEEPHSCTVERSHQKETVVTSDLPFIYSLLHYMVTNQALRAKPDCWSIEAKQKALKSF